MHLMLLSLFTKKFVRTDVTNCENDILDLEAKTVLNTSIIYYLRSLN